MHPGQGAEGPLPKARHKSAEILRFQDLVALRIDDLSLLVGHIVVLKELLADLSGWIHDLALGALN